MSPTPSLSYGGSETSSVTLNDLPGSFSTKELWGAAVAVHDVLTKWYIDHVFLGGYMAIATGHERPVDSIDVECRKKLFAGLDKLSGLFVGHADFDLLPIVRPHTVRVLHKPSGVPVNFMMRGMHDLISEAQLLTIAGRQLPFLSYTNFMAEKIRAAAARWHRVDEDDFIFVYKYRSWDWDVDSLRARVKKSVARKAAEKHCSLTPMLLAIGFSF